MIKSMRIHLGVTYLCLLIFGCGSNEQDPHPDKPVSEDREPLTLTYDNEAKNLEIFDVDCSENLAVSEIGVVDVWEWNGSALAKVSEDFSRVSGKGLASEFQRTASFGYHEIEHYECKDGCGADPYDRVLAKAATTLNICQKSPDLKRDSIESAALSMYAGANSAFQFYRSLTNAAKTISKMSFNILPNYERIYHHSKMAGNKIQNRSHTATDNAYWKLVKVSDTDIRQTIEVLPHSKELGNLGLTGADVRFWEVPMVLGHEFGHHIFYAHAPNLVAAVSAKFIDHELWSEGNYAEHPAETFGTEHLDFSNDLVGKNLDLGVILMPILEGFADLFGQYGQNQEQPFQNIRCLGVNRDLILDHFGDTVKTAKVLSSKSIALYNVSSGRDSFQDCNTPAVGNYYSVASVLAYGINALLESDLGRDNVGIASRAAKGAVILAWIETLNSELPAYDRKNLQNYLAYALDRFIAVGQGNRVVSENYCEILHRVFPFYLENIPSDSHVKFGTCALT